MRGDKWGRRAENETYGGMNQPPLNMKNGRLREEKKSQRGREGVCGERGEETRIGGKKNRNREKRKTEIKKKIEAK